MPSEIISEGIFFTEHHFLRTNSQRSSYTTNMGRSPEDASAAKLVRAELSRRQIDTTQADVRVMHGVVTIRGVIRGPKELEGGLKAEMELIGRILRQRQGIKDVVIDAVVR